MGHNPGSASRLSRPPLGQVPTAVSRGGGALLLKHPTHLRRHVAQLPGVEPRRRELAGRGNPGPGLARPGQASVSHERTREIPDPGEAIVLAHVPHPPVFLERVHPLRRQTPRAARHGRDLGITQPKGHVLPFEITRVTRAVENLRRRLAVPRQPLKHRNSQRAPQTARPGPPRVHVGPARERLAGERVQQPRLAPTLCPDALKRPRAVHQPGHGRDADEP